MFAKKIITAAILTGLSTSTWAATCSVDLLKADYLIENHHQTKDDTTKVKSKSFSLWRNNGLVAHQYQDKRIAEVWFQQKSKRVQLTRYFDEFQRGIEYQASEMRHNKGMDWQSKYALMPTGMLKSLEKGNTEFASNVCETVVNYSGTRGGEKVTLQWMPKLKLIKQLVIEKSGYKKQWLLQEKSTDSAAISAQYEQWGSFKTTDYADIGDNENDPFLLKMINIGFTGGEAAHRGHGGHGHHGH